MSSVRLTLPDVLGLRGAYLPYENPESSESLLSVKGKLDLWIHDEGLRQVYKRFLNHLLKEEPHNRALRAFIPLLVFEQAQLLKLLEREKGKGSYFHILLDYLHSKEEIVEELSKLTLPNLALADLKELRGVLSELSGVFSLKSKRVSLRFCARLAHTLFPQTFIGMCDYLVGRFNVVSVGAYMNLLRSIKADLGEEDFLENPYLLRDMEIGILTTLDGFPPKEEVLLRKLGIKVEVELAIRAVNLWNRRKFYRAHEVLEELWKLFKDNLSAREYLQGIIRLAIAYDHIQKERDESARKVLKVALKQIEMFKGSNTPVEVEPGEPFLKLRLKEL